MIAIRCCASLLILSTLWIAPACAQERPNDEASDRALRHATLEWQTVADHLPDPATAAPAALTLAAEVLRARRLPEDALDYYRFALQRGGNEADLDNQIGVTLLELQRFDEARVAFKRAVKLSPKTAQNWNNLGAVEYVSGRYRAALDYYLQAVKLDKKTAVFHSNLGTAYFELKDYDSAREQFKRAIRLNPNVFRDGGFTGVQAHVLSARDRGRFCFEMAKMAAQAHDGDNVVRWLARSSESGFDVKDEIVGDRDLEPYRKDARVIMAIQNGRGLRGQPMDSGLATPLPDSVN